MVTSKNSDLLVRDTDKYPYFDVNENAMCISVTKLIDIFTQPYDRNFWSAYKALEKLLSPEDWQMEKKSLLKEKKFYKEILDLYNISENDFNREQQNILDEWDKNSRESCNHGNLIHEELERLVRKDSIDLSKFGLGGKFIYREDNDILENGAFPEHPMSVKCQSFRLIGKPDLTIKNDCHVSIIDYKTAKEIKKKSGYDVNTKTTQKMKFPLNNLDDCNFIHYTLQLSTYAWMLQQIDPKLVIDNLILYHFSPSGKETSYNCEYLKSDVERMLAFYKKQAVLDRNRELRKPIEY